MRQNKLQRETVFAKCNKGLKSATGIAKCNEITNCDGRTLSYKTYLERRSSLGRTLTFQIYLFTNSIFISFQIQFSPHESSLPKLFAYNETNFEIPKVKVYT